MFFNLQNDDVFRMSMLRNAIRLCYKQWNRHSLHMRKKCLYFAKELWGSQ